MNGSNIKDEKYIFLIRKVCKTFLIVYKIVFSREGGEKYEND